MFSFLSLKWKLTSVGLLCSFLVALAGGAGVWSLNLIQTTMEETTVEISKNISYQNRQVKTITRLREIISAIQNIEDLEALEDLFKELNNLNDVLELKIAPQNIDYSDAVIDLFIKQHNLFVSKREIDNKRVSNNELLEQISTIALNIMENAQIQSELNIDDAFDKVKDQLTSELESSSNAIGPFNTARNITENALQVIKSASLLHVNCSRMDAYMKEIFSIRDTDSIRNRNQEIVSLLNNAQQEIKNLPDADDTWNITKLLVSLRSIVDQVAESQERVLQQESEFFDTVRKIYGEIGAAEQDILLVAQALKTDAENTLKNSSNLVDRWQKLEFLLMAIAFILAALIGFTLSRSVLRQLNSLNKGITIVGKGDLTYKVDTGTRDEIGQISRAFDHMASNIRMTQADLGRALERAEKANAAKSEFLANMSHELRTPLNAILGFTQILERNPDIPGSVKDELGIISRSGEDLLRMINDVLDFAKIESGQASLNHKIFELPRLLEGLEKIFLDRARNQHVRFLMDIASDIPQYIESDPDKIRQILINIIGNAFKFTPQGFVSVTLACQQMNKNDTLGMDQVDLQFEVKDSGVGIAPERLETIFNPFVQAGHSKEVTDGTGLGLAISQKFTHMLGGEISVVSSVGNGSSFRFHFPVTVSKEEKVEHTLRDRPITGLAPDQPKYRLLVVDDSDVNRLLLKELLEIVGFEVLEAENGKQGVEIFKTEHPDCVWMDMQMPVMDGYDASKIIKQSQTGREIPVIALTANVLEEQRKQILDAGCDDLVCKPFKQEDIFSILHRYLGVTYTYDDSPQPPETSGADKEFAQYLTGEAPLSLPEEMATELTAAALALDSDKCLRTIEKIQQTDMPAAMALRHLVVNFEFEKIHQLVGKTDKS